MVKLVFLCMVFFSNAYWLDAYGIIDLDDSTPEDLPFHAVVHSRMVCGGVLVTENYVIVPAYCVYGSSSATIYLGFRGYPYYTHHHSESNTQILRSNKIFIHEDFVKIADQQLLNNIALIKLSTPATLSNKVRPGRLIFRQETHSLEGSFAQISGWSVSTDTNIKRATVQIRNQDTCAYLFGDGFLRSQEYCVKWSTNSRLNLLGNPVSVDNTIIGFQTNTPTCNMASSSCSRNDMVLSFIPFLDWMAHKMDIPLEEFTVKDHQEKSCNNNDLRKVEHLIDEKIKKTISEEINNTKKCESDIANLNIKIENVLAELKIVKSAQVDFALSLNEQTGSIKTEINNRKAGIDQSILKLQEDFNGVRTEMTSVLTAQRSLNDSEAKMFETTEKLQEEVFQGIKKFEEEIKAIKNTTEYVEMSESEHFLQHQQLITKLQEKLDDAMKNRLELNGQFNHINNTIKNISSVQNVLRLDLEDLGIELTSNVVSGKLHMKKIEEKVDEISDIVHTNKEGAHLRFDAIERVFGEQRNYMDKHIIQENVQVHSLRSDLKSLNNSVNHIMSEYIYNDPIPN